jgi:hypothetical protein
LTVPPRRLSSSTMPAPCKTPIANAVGIGFA